MHATTSHRLSPEIDVYPDAEVETFDQVCTQQRVRRPRDPYPQDDGKGCLPEPRPGPNRLRHDLEAGTVILIISVAIVITVAIAAFVLAPRLFEPRLVYDNTPDVPAPFGYRMAWLAVQSTDAARIAEVLHLEAVDAANWRTGIGTMYDERLAQGRVYLSPPIGEWTFVVGLALPQPLGRGFSDKCTPMMLDLAANFPEAQYFLCYAPLDYFAWVRVVDGKLTRAFAIGDEGVIWNKGKPTREEKSLGLRFAEIRSPRSRRGEAEPILPITPTEEQLVDLASAWSLDPTGIGECKKSPGLGYICAAPVRWKPERLRRTG